MKRLRDLYLVLPLLLAACSDTGSLAGTYADPNEIMTYTFNKDGTVIQESMGMKTEFAYTKKDDQIKLQVSNGQNLILTLNEDGTIDGPVGILRKKD